MQMSWGKKEAGGLQEKEASMAGLGGVKRKPLKFREERKLWPRTQTPEQECQRQFRS